MDKLQELRNCLSSPDEEKRRLAVIGLAGYPFAEIKEYLIRALGDESWRIRKEAVELFSGLSFSRGMVEDLVALLRSSENAGLRNSAVEVLVRLGAEAVPVLSSFATDPDHDVRKFVIDIMGSIGEASFVPVLIRALDDPDSNVRTAAVENLGKIGDQRSVGPLLKSLENSDVWLQYAVLEALGRIGGPVPVSAIAPLVANELLKKAVYECLGSIGGVEAVPVLLDGLGVRSKNARQAAAAALEKVRERLPAGAAAEAVDSGLRLLKGTPAVERLLESMSCTDITVRKAVIRILGIIGDEKGAGALLRGCGDDRLRSCCLQAFKAIGEPVAPFLETEYPSADEGERCVIAYLCGEMGLKDRSGLLKQSLYDPSPSVRKEAVLACGKLGLAGLIPEIASLLNDFDPEVREGAIFALARLAESDRAGVARIAGLLASDDDPEKRRDSAHLFGALRDTERLSLLMKDEDVTVRKNAVSALADLKNSGSAGHLMMALVDEDPEVRIAAASALGDTAGENAVDSLLLLLKDEDPWVRCAALKSLGKLKGTKAAQAVESMFESASGAVLIAAIEALGAVGGDRAYGLLEEALKSEDEEVVKTAMTLLARSGNNWVKKFRDVLMGHPHWDVRNSFARHMTDLLGDKAVPYLKKALATENDALVREQIKDLVERYQ
ncbi:MAG TPA: HEAT repeat domain-containing protein [Geobacteraceae bacterium]|nr:HEAT repeat domain-containing protein [Geobacteraceae bacterium]